MSARHFELIKRPELIVPEAALRRRSICYSGLPPPVLTFVDDHQISDGGSTHTHTLSFGTASARRALVACVGCVSTGTPTATIGGVSAARAAIGDAGAELAMIFIALVPNGTSGNVVISGLDGPTSSVALYSVTNLKSLTKTDSDGDFVGGTVINLSLSVLAQGVILSSAYGFSNPPTGASWSGVTKDMQAIFGISVGIGNIHSAAHFVATSNTTRSVTATLSPTGTYAACVASFR